MDAAAAETSRPGRAAEPVVPFRWMDLESVRTYCLSLPHATEDTVFGEHLAFRIGGKMFALTALEGGSPFRISFKTSPERFAELVEMEDVEPAPYLARAKWAALRRWDALPAKELKTALKQSYELVRAGLPKKVQAALGS